eukprot:1653107-Amphidinium_carterae.2
MSGRATLAGHPFGASQVASWTTGSWPSMGTLANRRTLNSWAPPCSNASLSLFLVLLASVETSTARLMAKRGLQSSFN